MNCPNRPKPASYGQAPADAAEWAERIRGQLGWERGSTDGRRPGGLDSRELARAQVAEHRRQLAEHPLPPPDTGEPPPDDGGPV